ncbi:MAG: short chain dehydrogenase [Spirochaetes bacterium GWD1_27_9]|nr:MAG: short chain dehydrogenase [Spirochaetes bacterium GWB1_27_13]OHD21597.1 MAG: short chain dehydrogenase [Spirochaetes bacterium GWC1_27_15]OHD42775.1 MAG: short chain dehydrogenase [Spirochaetes bacterium GWD1_27_9]
MADLLKDKIVIITGGGSGIGKASSILFAKEGAKVVVANRRVEKGEETVKIIKENGGDALFIQTDVSKKEDIENLINKTVKHYGRLDIAFNCGGIDGAKKPIIDFEEQEWDEVIDVNLKGTFLLLKYEIKQMLKQNTEGVILNMASINGIIGRPNRCAYNSSRSGVIGLTKTASIEYIRKGIRINAIAPAAVKTDLFDKYTNEDIELQKKYAESHPIGRICEPEEVAEAALWLCSDKSSFVVGHILVIDGGVTIV